MARPLINGMMHSGLARVQISPGGAADQMMNPPKYVPGEIPAQDMMIINQSPDMSALYEKNKPLVTEYYTHQYDAARCQKLVAENPELAAALQHMQAQQMQQQQAMYQSMQQAQMNAYPSHTPGMMPM